MHVARIQVDGGFLDGLDLSFSAGFNVIIGARGSGKTSVIELIRFAFGSPVLSDRLLSVTTKHAEAVLGDGRVTLTVEDAGATLQLVRSAGEIYNYRRALSSNVLILAQSEIENIATDAVSRLRLIDSFIEGKLPSGDRENLRVVEATLTSLRKEIATLDEQLASYSSSAAELLESRKQQQQLLSRSEELRDLEKQLKEINTRTQSRAKSLEHTLRFRQSLVQWRNQVNEAAHDVPSASLLHTIDFDDLSSSLRELERAAKQIRDVVVSVEKILVNVGQSIDRLEKLQSDDDAKGRPIRQRLETSQKGAGQLARRIAILERKVAQAEAIAEQRKERAARYSDAQASRVVLLDNLDEMSSKKTLLRSEAAQKLSAHLKPTVRIDVAQRANLMEYAATISRVLRGTGLHAADLASQISSRMSPRQFVEFVETGDRRGLSRILGISPDRAQRLISALPPEASAAILDVTVEDDIRILLLVGPDYRPIEHLSTGQRCTAVLPILLSRPAGTLIIDQPEDHLDNAYIVDALVSAIQRRSRDLQVIVTTHNPNVPVLAEADRVIELASDGLHAYPRVADSLDSDQVVHAITSVMEGGLKAFERRAAFYQSHTT